MIIYSIFLFTEDKEKPHISTPNDSMDIPVSIERQIVISDEYLTRRKKDNILSVVFLLFI